MDRHLQVTTEAGGPEHLVGLEERARFFEMSLDLLCVATLNGYFIELSPSWERALGFTVDALRAEPFMSFIHPDDVESTQRAVAMLAKGERIASFMNRYRRADGGYALLEWSAFGVPEQGKIYSVARDVTAREATTRELRALHDRLQLALHAGKMVLYAFRPSDYMVTHMSESITEVFGYEPERFKEVGFWLQKIHPDDRERIVGEALLVLEQGQRRYEYRLQRADGAYRHVQSDARAVRDAAGQVVEVVGALHDITERKEVEQRLRNQAAALLELSTPLIPVSDDVLVMPLIGVMDGARASQVLETLLQGIADRRARVAILDVTGVGVVDTQVADALLRAARAAQLLGAEVVLTGIRPEVAQILVTLGADLGGITTCGTLQAGIRHAARGAPA